MMRLSEAEQREVVTIVASGLFAFANLSGIDAILYYAPVIFAEVGFGGTLNLILGLILLMLVVGLIAAPYHIHAASVPDQEWAEPVRLAELGAQLRTTVG